MNDKLSRQNCVLYICGILPVVWLALLAAPLLEGGLGTLLEGFGTALENPFHIIWCDNSLKTLLIFLMLYGLGIGIYVSNERVYRRREEQGSARWGNPLSIAKRYQQSGNANKLLTQQVALGLDGRKHRRNLNVLICGGSGAGKTRYYAKPNIMQANTSFVILDPKGELLRDTGHLLEEQGYVIKVLDLINPERSHCYNPFVYLRDDDDIQRLATNIMKNTTPKDSKSSDHFWEDMAAMLLIELLYILEISIDVVVIFIKGVLRQRDAGSAQQFRAEGAGVDHQDLIHPEPAHLVPAKNGFLWESIGKADGSVTLSIGMDIAVVRQKQVYPAPGLTEFQCIQKCGEIAAQSIITVHTLEVFSSGQGHAPVDACPMAAV